MADPLKVFISYARGGNDRLLLDELVKHLTPLIDDKIIDVWEDSKIPLNENFDVVIKENLSNADIFVMLLSKEYLASAYIKENEIPIAMQRRDARECKIVPVLLRPCAFKLLPYQKLSFIPKTKKQDLTPVVKWRNRDDAYVAVVEVLVKLIKTINKEKHDKKEIDLNNGSNKQRLRDKTNESKNLVFTCNRVSQYDAYTAHLFSSFEKVKFFYLYGHKDQAHKSFLSRLVSEFDYSSLEKEDSQKPIQINFPISRSDHPEVFKSIFIRDLSAGLGLAPDFHSPLHTKNLQYLIGNSPKVGELGPSDIVFLIAHVAPWNWVQNLTPDTIHWFITVFCKCTLPSNLPTFVFFFSFEYDEDEDYSPAVKEGILIAMKQSDHVKTLPELGMVKRRDVSNWLNDNKNLLLHNQTPKEILDKEFNEEEFFMEYVENVLTEIIDKYKNQQIR